MDNKNDCKHSCFIGICTECFSGAGAYLSENRLSICTYQEVGGGQPCLVTFDKVLKIANMAMIPVEGCKLKNGPSVELRLCKYQNPSMGKVQVCRNIEFKGKYFVPDVNFLVISEPPLGIFYFIFIKEKWVEFMHTNTNIHNLKGFSIEMKGEDGFLNNQNKFYKTFFIEPNFNPRFKLGKFDFEPFAHVLNLEDTIKLQEYSGRSCKKTLDGDKREMVIISPHYANAYYRAGEFYYGITDEYEISICNGFAAYYYHERNVYVQTKSCKFQNPSIISSNTTNKLSSGKWYFVKEVKVLVYFLTDSYYTFIFDKKWVLYNVSQKETFSQYYEVEFKGEDGFMNNLECLNVSPMKPFEKVAILSNYGESNSNPCKPNTFYSVGAHHHLIVYIDESYNGYFYGVDFDVNYKRVNCYQLETAGYPFKVPQDYVFNDIIHPDIIDKLPEPEIVEEIPKPKPKIKIVKEPPKPKIVKEPPKPKLEIRTIKFEILKPQAPKNIYTIKDKIPDFAYQVIRSGGYHIKVSTYVQPDSKSGPYIQGIIVRGGDMFYASSEEQFTYVSMLSFGDCDPKDITCSLGVCKFQNPSIASTDKLTSVDEDSWYFVEDAKVMFYFSKNLYYTFIYTTDWLLFDIRPTLSFKEFYKIKFEGSSNFMNGYDKICSLPTPLIKIQVCTFEKANETPVSGTFYACGEMDQRLIYMASSEKYFMFRWTRSTKKYELISHPGCPSDIPLNFKFEFRLLEIVK